MIQTVDSSKIDLTAARVFISNPKTKTLEENIEKYKQELKLNVPTFIVKSNYTISPFKHATDILDLISVTLGLDLEQLKSKKRDRHLVEARQIYCFLVMKYSSVEITLKLAGDIINKDHATVLHGVKQTIILNETNIPFSKKLDICISQFKKQFSGAEHFIADYNNIPQY